MASRATTLLSLGMAAFSWAGPVSLPQPLPQIEARGTILMTDPKQACQFPDFNDPANAQMVWEDWSVGHWLDQYLHQVGNANWVYNLVKTYVKDPGNVPISGCGTVNGACDVSKLDCTDMVKRGLGYPYWVLQAVQGFHAKLNIAHGLLDDSAIEGIFKIPQIQADFSAPKAWADDGGMAAIISSALFLIGGVAGLAGSAAAFAGVAAASERGVLKGLQKTLDADPKAPDLGVVRELIKATENTEKLTASAGRHAGALGGAVYLAGSSFGMVSATTTATGQVSTADLSKQLGNIFVSGKKQIDFLGALAVGGPGDWGQLPNQAGSRNDLVNSNPIAGFFSDGKWLIGDGNTVMQDSIRASYLLMQQKIVDIALQEGNFKVVSDVSVKKADDCTKDYGAQWITEGPGYCMKLIRSAKNDQPCRTAEGDADSPAPGRTCTWLKATHADYDNLQNKYSINMATYYKAAYQCAKSGKKDLQYSLPDDGSLPICWYNIAAQQAKFTITYPGPARGGSVQNVDFTNF